MLLQERGLGEISGISTSGEDDWSIDGARLSTEFVCDTSDLVSLLVDSSDAGLLDDLNTVWLGLGKLLKSLHESVCNGHTREFGIVTSVRSWVGVSTAGNVSSGQALNS